MNNSTIEVNSNVTIRCIDKYGKVTRTSRIHNKATVNLVEGLLRFLRGDFTPSKYNTMEYNYDPHEGYGYVPAEVRFGNIGVSMKNREEVNYTPPILEKIIPGEMKRPSFDEYKLQQELRLYKIDENGSNKFGFNGTKFESVSLASFNDDDNSEALVFHAYIPPGQLVGCYDENEKKRSYFTDSYVQEKIGEKGYGWTYFNEKSGEYEAVFTEIGLYSGGGTLLARVLFNGNPEYNDDGTILFDEKGNIIFEDMSDNNNPIVQSDTTSIIVEWRIGLVSVGQNDSIVLGSDLRNLGIDIAETGEDTTLGVLKQSLAVSLLQTEEDIVRIENEEIKLISSKETLFDLREDLCHKLEVVCNEYLKEYQSQEDLVDKYEKELSKSKQSSLSTLRDAHSSKLHSVNLRLIDLLSDEELVEFKETLLSKIHEIDNETIPQMSSSFDSPTKRWVFEMKDKASEEVDIIDKKLNQGGVDNV